MARRGRILAAIDLSPASRRALAEAVRICKGLDRSLHVIHVIEDEVVLEMADRDRIPVAESRQRALTDTRAALKRMLDDVDAPADTRLHLVIGPLVSEILSGVELLSPELVLLGEDGLSEPMMLAAPLSASRPHGRQTRFAMLGSETVAN